MSSNRIPPRLQCQSPGREHLIPDILYIELPCDGIYHVCVCYQNLLYHIPCTFEGRHFRLKTGLTFVLSSPLLNILLINWIS